MRKWYAKWLEDRRAAKINQLSVRIIELTETIEGTDWMLWPDIVEAYENERTRLAWKRSDLILANRKVTA